MRSGWGFCFPSSHSLRRILDQKSREKGAADLEESKIWFGGKEIRSSCGMVPGVSRMETAHALRLVDLGRSTRRDYIVAKYVEHRFARRSTPEPQKLRTAICNRDLLSVLEAFANGQDFGQLLPGPEGQVRTTSKGHFYPTRSLILPSPSPGPAVTPLCPCSDICSNPQG